MSRAKLFASVIFNDLLHWEQNCCDYALTALLDVMTKKMKMQCDNNIVNLPMFRNPDGSSIRRFKNVSCVTYLTTARRITLMFVWVHVLDTGALMLPEGCRRPALCMLSSMQTMILAAQGRRAYTVQEWRRLHVDQAMEFFGCIEELMHYKEEHDSSTPPFRPMQKYVLTHI